jgi:signal transduction histidine kinase/CheY-like chemotaxis protein
MIDDALRVNTQTAALSADVARVPLESVIITDELEHRSSRPRDDRAEDQALVDVTREMDGAVGITGADRVLQRIAEAALWLCGGGSAGVSVLERDGDAEVLRWRATAGRWAGLVGGSMPRERTASDVVLRRNAPMLLAEPGRHYGAPLGMPLTDEVLIIPFHHADRPAGTLWVVSHDAKAHRFDAGDRHLLMRFARVTGDAYGLLVSYQRRDEAAQRRLETELADSRLLQTISAALITPDDETGLYEKILDAAIAITGSDFASLQMFFDDASGGELRLIANRGFSAEAATRWARIDSSGVTNCSEVLRHRRRVISPDVREAPFLAGSAADDYVARGILAVLSTPLMSRAGRLVGVFSTHWRSPHVPAERDLRLLDILARQAADLIERKQAEDLLREGDRRKEEFLATLAHELRNPLAPIRNAVEIMRRSGTTDPTVAWARDVISRQTDHLTRLVDDLLDVSRINRDRLELQMELVPLSAVLDAAIETSQQIIEHQCQSLAVSQPDEPVLVRADPTRLSQVFANLLNNAAKFSTHRSTIELSVERKGDDVVLRVRDHGVGLDASAIPHLFDPFGQPRRSFERGEGGLGIGLALVKRLVELHGGRVSAHSDGIGQGSEFSVWLPIGAYESARATKGTDPPREQTRALTVLVVDDHEDGATSMCRLLRALGHETRQAGDGVEGFQAAAEFRPDVALIDLGMPRVNGYELARLLRAEPWGQTMTLVAVTGWGQEGDKRRTADARFDHHLTKPVDLRGLERALSQGRTVR